MAKTMKDIYANKAYGSVQESGSNTLTFSEIQTNVNIFQKIAWVVHRIEWYLGPAVFAYFVETGDTLDLALVASNTITALGLSDAAVIDLFTMSRTLATSVGFRTHEMPIVRDFGSMPGGGIIIAPRPLYVAAKGTGLSTAVLAELRFYFTQKEMTPSEYLELIDFYRIVS